MEEEKEEVTIFDKVIALIKISVEEYVKPGKSPHEYDYLQKKINVAMDYINTARIFDKDK